MITSWNSDSLLFFMSMLTRNPFPLCQYIFSRSGITNIVSVVLIPQSLSVRIEELTVERDSLDDGSFLEVGLEADDLVRCTIMDPESVLAVQGHSKDSVL